MKINPELVQAVLGYAFWRMPVWNPSPWMRWHPVPDLFPMASKRALEM